ncbi:hypothetical protein L6R29_19430 [Myxococcota bacterium]|nr:hypothetical protein [Myxococcota bacterium]
MIAHKYEPSGRWMASWKANDTSGPRTVVTRRGSHLLRMFGEWCVIVLSVWGLAGCSISKQSMRSDAPSALDYRVSKKMDEGLPSEIEKAKTEIAQLSGWINEIQGRKVVQRQGTKDQETLVRAGATNGSQQSQSRPTTAKQQDLTPRAQPSHPQTEDEPQRRREAVQITRTRPWWAPPPPRTMAYRQLTPKERICRSAQMICRISERICKIAARHPERPTFQTSCVNAQKDCLDAQKRCKAAN